MKRTTIIVAAILAAACCHAQTENPAPLASTNLHTAMLFTVGVDTKKAVPPNLVFTDVTLLNCQTNGTTLMLQYTQSVANVTITSPGYEAKTLHLVRVDNTMVVGLHPGKPEPQQPH